MSDIFRGFTDPFDQAEVCLVSASTAVLANGTTIFTVANGPINILQLISYCMTACDGTAATLQWSADGTVGAATTFTGASASLASLIAGAAIVCDFTALSTAPAICTAGVGLSANAARGIIVPAGIITTVVGSGPTTGTFKHFLRYQPMGTGIIVT